MFVCVSVWALDVFEYSERKQGVSLVSYNFSGKSTSTSSLMHLTQWGLKLLFSGRGHEDEHPGVKWTSGPQIRSSAVLWWWAAVIVLSSLQDGKHPQLGYRLLRFISNTGVAPFVCPSCHCCTFVTTLLFIYLSANNGEPPAQQLTTTSTTTSTASCTTVSTASLFFLSGLLMCAFSFSIIDLNFFFFDEWDVSQ